jgi:hypothetical protein
MKPVQFAQLFAIVLAGMSVSLPAYCQDNYEIQVYQSALISSHHTMVELHSNTSLKKSKDDNLFSDNFFRETIEITHGFTPWLEVGSYLFTNVGIRNSTDIVGVHFRPRVAIPSEAGLPVGLSLSSEIGYIRKKFSPDEWTLELRPIIDKEMKRLTLSLNMVFSLGLDRSSSHQPELGAAFKASYESGLRAEPGVEYYGGYGALSDFMPSNMQTHQVFGVVDLDLGPDWEFNSGLGWSLNAASDRLMVKFILGRRFGF